MSGVAKTVGNNCAIPVANVISGAQLPAEVNFVDTGVLRIAYLEDGAADGWPVVLSHGFPYDVHAFDEVVRLLASHGARVIRPYLRGFGPTRFLSDSTLRSGQQAALGSDLLALLEALGLEGAIVAGYDWGGLASCVVAALRPQSIAGLVSLASYDIVNIVQQQQAQLPELEHVMWYQHLFQSRRGRDCLSRHRIELCRLLWSQWSPHWIFSAATFLRTAAAFDNPDFVDVVVHAYRHNTGCSAGDPALQKLEDCLASQPGIRVPAVTLDGIADPLKPGGTAHQRGKFLARHEHRQVAAGHNLPQEAPAAFADAILTVRKWVEPVS